ncbi:MAG: hypothetical protein HUJ88_13685 [Fusobacterium necrophorum]|nr:hypothetical protein [Fusobacterium necrophorum]
MLENKYDIEILGIFFKNKTLSKENILKFFPEEKYATSERIDFLFSENLIFSLHEETENYPFYRYTENYEITPTGRKMYQDIKVTEHLKKIEYYKNLALESVRSIFCSIIISIITTIVYNYFFNK